MSDLPEPLNGTDCDLRGYEYMPMFGARLFSSTFDAKATDQEFRSAMRLWWTSWQECPAGSLPDDDDVLCKAAMLGRDMKTWFKIKARALHGFIKCSDGRLHHPLLADKAREAFARRKKERDRKAEMRARKVSGQVVGHDADVPRDNPGTEQGTTQGQTADVFRGDRRGEERIGEDKEERKKEAPKPSRVLVREDDPDFVTFWKAYPRKDGKDDARKAWTAAVRENRAADILEGVRNYRFNPNPEFIKYPAGWLRAGSWKDVQADDGMDPVLRAAGVTQGDLDSRWGNEETFQPAGFLR